eukprot:scaffold123528_cov64-Phaeocystis_antarctica.AAC.1
MSALQALRAHFVGRSAGLIVLVRTIVVVAISAPVALAALCARETPTPARRLRRRQHNWQPLQRASNTLLRPTAPD